MSKLVADIVLNKERLENMKKCGEDGMSLIRSQLLDKALQVGERHLLIDTNVLDGGRLKQNAIDFGCRYVVEAFDTTGRWQEEGYYQTLEEAQIVFNRAELQGTSVIHAQDTIKNWAEEERRVTNV